MFMQNQQWIWTIFDTFWESVFGPCLHAMAYFTASVSRLYDSEFVTWIASVLNACLRIASIAVDWAFWVISSWASYFDWVPTIKHAFATIGDWLQASARTLVNKNYLPEKISGIDSGVAESYFSFIWKHSAAFITLAVAILGNSWNKCTDYLDEMSSNESFSHILAVIKNNISLVLVPNTGMPWGLIALVSSIWTIIYMYRNFINTTSSAIKMPRGEYWKTWISQMPFTEWHWVEVPELVWQRIILPITHQGIWDGFRYWISRAILVWKAIGRGLEQLLGSRAGIGLLAVGIASSNYLLVKVDQSRNVVVQVLAIAPASLISSAVSLSCS